MSPITATKIGIDGETKVKLEKIEYVVMTQFEASLLDGQVDVQFWEGWADEWLVARVVGFVWGEDFARRTISFPRNWIEALKERWAPRWYRKRHPVRYEIHHIEAKAYYPGIQPSMPHEEWRIAAYTRDGEEEEGNAFVEAVQQEGPVRP